MIEGPGCHALGLLLGEAEHVLGVDLQRVVPELGLHEGATTLQPMPMPWGGRDGDLSSVGEGLLVLLVSTRMRGVTAFCPTRFRCNYGWDICHTFGEVQSMHLCDGLQALAALRQVTVGTRRAQGLNLVASIAASSHLSSLHHLKSFWFLRLTHAAQATPSEQG